MIGFVRMRSYLDVISRRNRLRNESGELSCLEEPMEWQLEVNLNCSQNLVRPPARFVLITSL